MEQNPIRIELCSEDVTLNRTKLHVPIRNETDNLDYLFEEQSFFLMLSDSPNVSPRYNLSAEIV